METRPKDAPRPASPSLQVPTGAGQLGEERRQVTVLFADLVGSTTLAGRLDPEELRAVLGSFFAAIAQVVQRYEGTLDKYIGDAVMAVFGAPVAHEDDAARALHAALGIQEAVAAANVEVGDRHGARLAVRMGISSGEVVSGLLAHEVQSAYTVVGETVNVAQRLQAAAQPGEILVAAATQRLARGFAFDPPRLITLKNKTEPVAAHRLIGLRRAARPEQETFGAALVGRRAELAALEAALGQLDVGTGAIVAIVGEAGVGKSRLVTELRRRLGASGPRWLDGRALSIGHTISYLPFLEIIRADAGITDHDTAAESWPKLRRRVEALFPSDAAEILPYLASLIGLEPPPDLAERVRQLTADAMRRQIFLVSRRYVGRLADEAPVVLLIEDIHWADDSSLALLEHLAPVVEARPLAICVTARPDAAERVSRLREIASRDGAARFTEIAMRPLSREESGELVVGLLDAERVPSELRELILGKTGGNPFFIEEVVRSLVESGVVVRDRSGAALARPVAEVDIPDSVQGVIQARIDRLDEELKHVIRVAAVVGRSFLYRVLRAVADVDRELDGDLGQLQRLELIAERARLPELEDFFRHVLIQESTYESILMRRRRELHHRVGEAVESLFAQRLEDFYGVLAYHFAPAEDWTKAQDYLFRAADQAGRVAADAEALALYDEAIAAYARVFGDKWDPLQRGTLERKIGEALFHVGEYPRAEQHVHRALQLLGRPFPKSKAQVRLAILGELGRQIVHRLAPQRLPKPDAAAIDARAAERFRCYEVTGWIYYYIDNERLLLNSIRSLNESESTGWPLGIVVGSLGMGIVCDFIPAFDLAERYHRRGVALAEATQLPLALGYAYMGLGYHQQRAGEWHTALDNWARGAAHFRGAGDLAKWGAATWGTTWLAHRKGMLGRSLSQSEELIRVGADTADRQLRGWGLYFRGRGLGQRGEVEEGVRSLEEAIALFREIPDLPNLAGASGELGICRLRQGRWREAVEIRESTARLMREQDIRGFLAHVHNALADAYLSQAEETTGAERESALRRAAGAVRSAMTRSKVEREGFGGAFRVRGTYGWITGRATEAREDWRRSLEHAGRLGARYDAATTHLEIGRRTGERAHLEQAAAIFDELGAKLDLERARSLLARA